MNTGKTLVRKNLMSVAVTLVLTTSTTAFAKTDEDKKKESVFTWGPWAGQVVTAAGGDLVDVRAVIPPDENGQFRAGDFDEVDPKVNATSQNEQYRSYATIDGAAVGTSGYDVPASIVFLTPSEAEVSPITTAYDGGELGLLITPDSGELAGNVSTGAAGTAFVSSTNAFLINPGTSGAAVNSNDQAAAASGSWRVDLSSTDYYGASTVTGNFIAGIASSALAIDSLVAGLGAIQVANYSGSNVNMAINFANSTWSGNVYGGAGRGGHTYTVNGGTVSGADFSATTENITASYTQYSSPINVVSGQINGSVFGSAAATVGGIYDVTTNDDGTYRDVGLFTATLQRGVLLPLPIDQPPIAEPPTDGGGASFSLRLSSQL